MSNAVLRLDYAGVSASAGQEDAAAQAAASYTWDGRTEVHRAERIPRSEYVRQLDDEADSDPVGVLCFRPCEQSLDHGERITSRGAHDTTLNAACDR